MGFGTLFWNDAERRLRAVWRIVLQLALSFAFAALPLITLGELLSHARHQGFLSSLAKESFDQLGNIVLAPIVILALYWSLRLGAQWIEHRGFSVYGSTPNRRWWRELACGIAFATLLMTLIFAVELLAGWVRITGHLDSAALSRAASIGIFFSLVKVVCVGIYEEWISRGLVLRNLTDGLTGLFGLGGGPAAAAAVILSSALFSLLHLTSPNIGVAGLGGIFLIGVLLGVAYVATGRLAVPMGFHLAWNLVQGVVFGLPVSGDLEPTRILSIRQEGPALWTGGAFGPEAGLVAMAVTLLGLAALVVHLRAEVLGSRATAG
jgi:membrane protease YdiL (CAAX protease family)